MLQADEAHILVIALKLQNIADRGAAETVDRLIVVADHADALMFARNLAHDFELRLVGILILVDHHIAELGGVFGAHRGVGLEQFGGVEQDIVKVQSLVEQQRLLVEPVDGQELAFEVVVKTPAGFLPAQLGL